MSAQTPVPGLLRSFFEDYLAAQRDVSQMIQAFHEAAVEQSLGIRVAERQDHDSIIVRCTLYVKRRIDVMPRSWCRGL